MNSSGRCPFLLALLCNVYANSPHLLNPNFKRNKNKKVSLGTGFPSFPVNKDKVCVCVCVVCSGNIGSVFPSCLKASASPWSIRVYGCGNSLEPPLASSSISIREPSLVPFSSLSNWMAKRQKPPELRYRHR